MSEWLEEARESAARSKRQKQRRLEEAQSDDKQFLSDTRANCLKFVEAAKEAGIKTYAYKGERVWLTPPFSRPSKRENPSSEPAPLYHVIFENGDWQEVEARNGLFGILISGYTPVNAIRHKKFNSPYTFDTEWFKAWQLQKQTRKKEQALGMTYYEHSDYMNRYDNLLKHTLSKYLEQR